LVKTRHQTPESLNIALLENFFSCSVLKWLKNTGYFFTFGSCTNAVTAKWNYITKKSQQMCTYTHFFASFC